MNRWAITIDPDIRRASTLPGHVYSDPDWFGRQAARVLARSWHVVADESQVAVPGSVFPFTLLPGVLDEPLIVTRDPAGSLHCLSNVCTHRANRLVTEAGVCSGLRCRYHGRRFGLDGRFHSMPEFEDALDFPSPADDLPRLELGRCAGLLATGVAPAMPFDALVAPVIERLGGWFPLDRLIPDLAAAQDYEVRAPWALYCDNYLEGFHIPYVHPGLAGAVDYPSYRTETFPWGSLQIAEAAAGEAAFEAPSASPPPGHPEHGRRIAAYYFWLFPATMLNFYPWGLSLNVVVPMGPARTRVLFRTYVGDAAARGKGAGSGLDQVEAEDEAVVEQVALGVKSRLYRRGRYSPTREIGVHHFHRLLARMLAEDA
jgi:choline monooxygenase